jgi:hypothetical protein
MARRVRRARGCGSAACNGTCPIAFTVETGTRTKGAYSEQDDG